MIYKHDCGKCVFLGSYRGKDLYCCPSEKTIVIRYGDDGSDYNSCPISGAAFYIGREAMQKALELAKRAGLATR